VRGMTPLMLAIATDHGDPRIVRLLLAHGADPAIKSNAGEDAYDWARKFRVPEVMTALHIPPPAPKPVLLSAHPPIDAASAVRKSIRLLQTTTDSFFTQGGCASCHAQNVTSLALNAARANGFAVDETAAAARLNIVKFGWTLFEQPLLMREDPPGVPDTSTYGILDLAAANQPPDRSTDAMVFNTAALQRASGEWSFGFIARPPVEDGAFSGAALGIRALQLFGMPARKAEFDSRIARAAHWLATHDPVTTQDRNMTLLGLKWAGYDEAAIQKLVRDVRANQRADGGWAQTRYLDSDAYATAQSLYALQVAGVRVDDPAYRRGVAFLLGTQQPDGSWHVASRAPKFQPYFQSGFPHGHDQWISSMATGLAVMALAPAAHDNKMANLN